MKKVVRLGHVTSCQGSKVMARFLCLHDMQKRLWKEFIGRVKDWQHPVVAVEWREVELEQQASLLGLAI